MGVVHILSCSRKPRHAITWPAITWHTCSNIHRPDLEVELTVNGQQSRYHLQSIVTHTVSLMLGLVQLCRHGGLRVLLNWMPTCMYGLRCRVQIMLATT